MGLVGLVTKKGAGGGHSYVPRQYMSMNNLRGGGELERAVRYYS